MKIHRVGTELFHADGQMERHNRPYICIQDFHFQRAKLSQHVLWIKSLNVQGQVERYSCPCAFRQGTCEIKVPPIHCYKGTRCRSASRSDRFYRNYQSNKRMGVPGASLDVSEKNETCCPTRRQRQDLHVISGQTGRRTVAATSPTAVSRVKPNHQVARFQY